MKVGERVRIQSDRPKYFGKEAFIEEIIIDPDTDHKGRCGLFSLYGIEAINGDYYYGDWAGKSLVATGKMMTPEELETYKQGAHLVGGFANDIDIVIENLGRESGRNGQ